MSRVSVAEHTKLSVFLARGMLRKLVARVTGHPLVRWPFFPGKVVICDARSPFEVTPPSDDWAAALLGFGWLRHLRAAESGITRANARALVDEWITLQSTSDPIAWRPDVMARRIISLLTQATLVLDDSDVRFYR